jgi:hypothetical protein
MHRKRFFEELGQMSLGALRAETPDHAVGRFSVPIYTWLGEQKDQFMSQIFFVAVRCIAWLGQSLCVSLEDSLSVRVNIIQPKNGQDRFTAERVARTRPKTYRAIALLLADPDAKIEHIAQRHRVSTHTVRAIKEREVVAIAERKQRLISIFGNVAEIAGERMEELAGGASLRDAGTTAGIATDKLLALLGETGGGVPVEINLYPGVAELLHKRYFEMLAALPNRETLSEPFDAMDLQSGKESLQK